MDAAPLSHNFTVLVAEEDVVIDARDDQYEQFLADVWVGVVLTLMVLSCVCCVCSCLLYHKFQQWKRSVLESRASSNLEAGDPGSDAESLPSYTIVSGLPTYEEALELLRQVQSGITPAKVAEPLTNCADLHQTAPLAKLSVGDLLQVYKSHL